MSGDARFLLVERTENHYSKGNSTPPGTRALCTGATLEEIQEFLDVKAGRPRARTDGGGGGRDSGGSD